jgi:hypothetical protein
MVTTVVEAEALGVQVHALLVRVIVQLARLVRRTAIVPLVTHVTPQLPVIVSPVRVTVLINVLDTLTQIHAPMVIAVPPMTIAKVEIVIRQRINVSLPQVEAQVRVPIIQLQNVQEKQILMAIAAKLKPLDAKLLTDVPMIQIVRPANTVTVVLTNASPVHITLVKSQSVTQPRSVRMTLTLETVIKYTNLYKCTLLFKMIFLLLLTSASALTVLDTYDVHGIPEYTPNISIPTKDPYYGNISTFELHNSQIHIPVYGLDGRFIRYVNEVYVECYTDNDCDYVLTQKDLQYLSLYASFIEAHSPLSTSYALGLLRNKDHQNIMGMYTLDYHVLNNYIGFWVRLERYGSHVYNDKVSYARTLSLLELAIHERSHHDAPTYNANMAHCDEFQVNYNSLIQYAASDIDKYNALAESILHGIEPDQDFPVWIPILIGSVVFIVGICWIRIRCNIQ